MKKRRIREVNVKEIFAYYGKLSVLTVLLLDFLK